MHLVRNVLVHECVWTMLKKAMLKCAHVWLQGVALVGHFWLQWIVLACALAGMLLNYAQFL